MKITVKKEGRANIYVCENKDNLKNYIKDLSLENIHNFMPTNFAMLGADHSLESVLEDIDRAERIAIFTDESNMGHSLALIINNELQCFDIGKLSEDNLEILA